MAQEVLEYTPALQTKFAKEIIPGMMKEFSYKSNMEAPKLLKIIVNQGVGGAVADKKMIDNAIEEITTITGQKAVPTYARKDISNFKLRKGMAIGVRVTLRNTIMYEFLERLIHATIPRIRDFNGLKTNFDGHGNYTMGVQEQIIFPEVDIDKIQNIGGLDITFVTSAKTDKEGLSLLKNFGLPFINK